MGRQQTILVTGGAGFIGGNIANALVREGFSVTVFDNLSAGNRAALDAEVRFVKGDVCNARQIEAAMEGIDTVIHCAGKISVGESFKKPELYYDTNVIGTRNVLEAMRKHRVSRILFSSTAGVYDPGQPKPLSEKSATHPLSPYGATKLIAEEMLKFYHLSHGFDVVIFRYFNLYGPNDFKKHPQNVIPIFIEAIRKGKPLTVHGGGNPVRDYIYIDDLVRAHRMVLNLKGYHLYNLGSGKGYPVNRIIASLSRAFGKPLKRKNIPLPEGYPREMYADISLARRELGWKPHMELDEGIKKTVEFFLSR